MGIRSKLLSPLIFLGLSFSGILHLYWLPTFYESQISELRERDIVHLEVLGTGLIPSLLSGDLARIHATLDQTLAKQNSWNAINLKTPEGSFLYPIPAPEKTLIIDSHQKLTLPIRFEDHHIADLELVIDVEGLLASQREQITSLELLLLAVLFFITIVAALVQDRWIRRPIKLLAVAASTVAEGNFDHELPSSSSKDEVGELLTSFKLMRDNLLEWERRLTRHNAQLKTISTAQSRYIQETDIQGLFDRLLLDILQLTGSQCGFIGEVLYRDKKPYLRIFSVSHLVWNEKKQRFHNENGTDDIELADLNALFVRVMTNSSVVIENDLVSDNRKSEKTTGHLELNTFLGVPFLRAGKTIGLFGLCNNDGGYHEELVKFIEPVISTCTYIIEAVKADRQRVKTELKIREEEIRMRTIFENVVDGIITTNEKGVIESFNNAASVIFGYSASETIGKNIKMLVPGSLEDQHDGFMSNYLKDKDSNITDSGREIEGQRKDGSFVPIDITVNEMWIDDQRFFCSIMRDITERQKVDKMKSEFVSTVSHELRTPLTAIKGALGLVLGIIGDQIPENMRDMLTLAKRNTERLTLLINDILDLEKIESGQLEFNLQKVNLYIIAQRATEDNQGYAYEHKISLVFKSQLEHAYILGDEHRLLQVFANLISNAVKYSNKNGTVEILLTSSETGFRISVRDFGPGIPEEFRSRIFQRFAQADSSDTRKIGGTGLGLSICKAIIDYHKGKIDYDAELGVGTVFYFDMLHFQSSE